MSNKEVKVKYNDKEISPPPFVSRSANPLDYGKRWGYEDVITLKGQYFISGNASGEVDVTGFISGFTDIFKESFKKFQVLNDGVALIEENFLIVDEISFESNHFHPKTYIPYQVKLRKTNVPSGIVDPSNEYSFTQNENGTVNISHKISARGIVTSSDSDSALKNAKSFVRKFTGINVFDPIFVSKGSGVLLSVSESLDRLNATYSINESYIYNSGESLPYVYIHSLDIDQSPDTDYISLGFNYSRQGSSINSNFYDLRTGFTGFDVYNFLQSKYGFDTEKFFLNNYNISEESGRNFIQYSCNIFSGIGDEFTGFFDYNLDLKWDKILDIRNFTINGSFESRAPISLKKQFLQNFKDQILNSNLSYQKYLYNIVSNSFLNSGYCSVSPPRAINPIPKTFSIDENTGLADLSLNATFDDKDFLENITETTFSISIGAPKNIYEFKPSANIEGNYVIQDLQTSMRESVKINANLVTTGNVNEALLKGIILENNFSDKLLNNGYFLTESGYNTGIFDLGINSSYLNNGSKIGLDLRHFYSQNAPSIRPPGYKYGL